ncbi:MAG: bifunctional phosphopantothenoylcysteine decarboxylase/phosphopantothenate--cysteine ligase CoaBC, partial [Actinomycetota bacterium]|nr:bifunctional phosphopantothenoylcysteine decarboxylase/phosphopantothenate--cysteine ligase CoaBC [Actinomycetota bacterium]
ASTKLSKADGVPALVLEPTVDIVAQLGAQKAPSQLLVGFAAEVDGAAMEARAGAKLRDKNLDLIVANDVSSRDAGFDSDTNRAMIISADGTTEQVLLVDKRELARRVIDVVVNKLSEHSQEKT